MRAPAKSSGTVPISLDALQSALHIHTHGPHIAAGEARMAEQGGTITAATRRVLLAIARGEEWRASGETIEAVEQSGLARDEVQP